MPNNADYNSYRYPPAGTNPTDLLARLTDGRTQGETFLQSQRGYEDMDSAIDVIAGTADKRRPASLSRISPNWLKRAVREIVASLSNIRPMWNFKNDNRDYDNHSAILNKLLHSWYLHTFADRRIRKALQYAAVQSRGYVMPVWKKDFWCFGRGDIELKVLGPRDVIPEQVGADNDLQQAYAVHIHDEMPLNLAHATWPAYQDQIVPDRSGPSNLRRGGSRIARFISPVLDAASRLRGREADNRAMPTVDIFYTYIIDTSVNFTGQEMHMGEQGTSWAYKVPFVGQDLPTGINDPQGRPTFRKALPEDCQIYPKRRMVTWTRSCVMRDGPSYWWHGMVPVVPFSIDDWPWEFLGYSAIRDGASIQDSGVSLLRAIDDSQNARLRPPLAYDEDSLSKQFMERFDPRQPGQKVPHNLSMGDAMKLLVPSAYYDVPQTIFSHIGNLVEMMKDLLGVKDVSAIAKARQIPSADAMEKMVEMAGPLMTDMSRTMEASIRLLGEMVKGLFFQFYDAQRRIQVMGEDGITEQDYDFEPSNMVPSHLPGEPEDKPSALSRLERARWHMHNIFLEITPNSLHQITQTTRKLMLLQLLKAGMPVDWWTIAEAFDIPNFGSPPAGARTVVEKWVAQQRIVAELKQALSPPQQPGQGKGGGRPNSNGKAPHIASKDGGTRSTISTS